MPTTLTVDAIEQSTYAITVAFTDEDGVAIIPGSIKWTLTDTFGNVINSRTEVDVTPAASITIVLHGLDLAVDEEAGPERVVTIEGTYNSTLGNGLEIKDEVRFNVVDLIKVSG